MCRSVEKLANEQKKLGIQQGMQQGIQQGMQRGMQQGKENALLDNLRNLTETLHLTMEQAMDALKVPQEDRPRLLEKLAQ